MGGWMINCKEYAELTSQSMERKISFWDKFTIKLHQMICPPCKQVDDQFSAMRSACRSTSDDEAGAGDDCRLSDEACERIKSAVREVTETQDREP